LLSGGKAFQVASPYLRNVAARFQGCEYVVKESQDRPSLAGQVDSDEAGALYPKAAAVFYNILIGCE
jgi:hypothetical protein